MDSFLGVPVVLRGVAYGNLYLTEKEGGDFTDDDQELIRLLAAQAAVAIENARLYESATRWSRQLESLHETVRSVVDETDVTRLLTLVCERLRELTHARLALAVLPPTAAMLARGRRRRRRRRARRRAARPRVPTATHRSSAACSSDNRARASIRSSTIPTSTSPRRVALGARTGLYAPLIARGHALGVIAVHDKLSGSGRFTDGDLRLAEIFAATRRSRDRAVRTSRARHRAARRRRPGRRASPARARAPRRDRPGPDLDPARPQGDRRRPTKEDAERAEADVRVLVVQALQDVRALAVELRPSALDDFGLGLRSSVSPRPSASEAASRRPSRRTSTRGCRPRSRPRSTASCRKRSRTSSSTPPRERVSIVVSQRGRTVAATIDDDGQGFDEGDDPAGRLGLDGDARAAGPRRRRRSRSSPPPDVGRPSPLRYRFRRLDAPPTSGGEILQRAGDRPCWRRRPSHRPRGGATAPAGRGAARAGERSITERRHRPERERERAVLRREREAVVGHVEPSRATSSRAGAQITGSWSPMRARYARRIGRTIVCDAQTDCGFSRIANAGRALRSASWPTRFAS